MKEIKTKFGATLYVEELSHDRHYADREDETKIKFFDTKEKYLDYFEVETLEDLAEDKKSTPEAVLESFVKEIEECDSIEKLLDYNFGIVWYFYAKNWRTVADWMIAEGCYFDTNDVSEQDILNHVCTNIIGDYIVVVEEN